MAICTIVFGGNCHAQVDGSRTSPGDNYGAAVSVQQVQTQFGDANPDSGSELDAAYVYTDGTNLYLMLTGNLENNFNKMEVFIDSQAGGENIITADTANGGNNPTNDGWANKYAGLKFDTGFEADFLIICRNGNFEGDRFDIDFNSVGNDSVVETASDVFGGTFEGSNGMLPNGIIVGFDNSNTAGVMGGTLAADTVAAQAVETGIELSIPLAAINASVGDTIKIAAHINGSNHDFLSNQILGALAPPQGNLGGDGMGTFTGDVGGVDFTAFAEDQFFLVDIESQTVSVVPEEFEVTRGTYVSGGLPELAESDNMDLSIRRNGGDTSSRTEFEAKGTSPTETPSSFGITVEGSAFFRSTVVQTIELYDYDAAAWVLVDTRNASRLVDSVVSLTGFGGDLGRFVENGTRSIEARIHFESLSRRQNFASNTDQVIWTIGQ